MKTKLLILVCLFTAFYSSAQHEKADEEWEKGRAALKENSAFYVHHPKSIKASIKYYNKALKYDPNHYMALCDRGLSYYYQKKFDLALADIEKALSLKPSVNVAHEYLGIVYHELGDHEMAVKHYTAAKTQVDSIDMYIYFNIGLMYEDIEEYELAIAYLDTAVSLVPDDKYNYSARASSKMRSGKYAEAYEDASKALSMDPNYIIALINRGLSLYYQGKYEEAIDDFERAMAIDLGKIQSEYEKKKSIAKYAHNNIANCYFKMQNQEKACKHWKKAIALGYEYQQKWKRIYGFDDPKLMISKHCGK